MRQSLEQPADLARIKSISADAESISLAAQKLSLQLESANEPQLTRLYDLALRNDMLAQRLARIYLDINAGHNGGSQQVDLRQTQREFATSLKELQIAPEGNDRIRRKLQLAQQQWLFFDSAVSSNLKQDGQAMRNVTTTSERISEVMVDIAKNYKDLISPPVLAQK